MKFRRHINDFQDAVKKNDTVFNFILYFIAIKLQRKEQRDVNKQFYPEKTYVIKTS